MTFTTRTGKPKGGNFHPLSSRQFILDYLRSHSEAYVGQMRKAYLSTLDQLASDRGKKFTYRHPTPQSFYHQVAGLEREGLIRRSGLQEATEMPMIQEWDERPNRIYYELAR